MRYRGISLRPGAQAIYSLLKSEPGHSGELDTRGLATELGQEIVERFTTKVLTIRLKPQEPEG